VEAVLWRDYLCPWCHLGRDRTALLESLGVTVVPRAYELHPEIPIEGRAVRPEGRLAAVLDHIAAESAAVGLAFRRPTRIANTRDALEVSEAVRQVAPEAFRTVDTSFYEAQWVHDRDLGDPAVVDELVAVAGVDVGEVRALVAAGEGALLVDQARAEALDHDVTGTPAWWVDDRLLIPGVQDRETVQRWVERLRTPRKEPGVPG
jgi:predicted DsbA family dithiol-disulfide isomerase